MKILKTRDAYYDNAKFLLIFLVVLGHFIQSYIHDSKFIFTLYTTIYLFHMPAFILISGYFAKGFRRKGYLTNITKKLIGPYLIFQGIYSFYYYFIQGKDVASLDPLNPQWSLWFLLSLFSWNLLLFLFTKWNVKTSMLLAFALGILVGYINFIDSYLSLSRTIVFFPLFLLGFYFKKEHFVKLRTHKVQFLSLLFFISFFIIIYLLPEIEYKWLFGSKPYEVLDQEGLKAGMIRLAVYSLTLVATVGFLALVPKKNVFFTKWGTRSIYIYLLHGFFIQYFRNSEWVNALNEPWQFSLLILASFLLTAFLASNLIKTLTQPLIEFKKG
ncbi:acyltransferase family protein [Niallia sp. Krafla_26]|uniref:acyltransferase family protein n=1 Tax=Niallia sp. Krafla_26 TaxID=3064703 RepID=UPI003D16C821